MSIIEKWQARAEMVAREAAAHSDVERARHCEGEEKAWKQAIVDMNDACTLRAPNAGWFGDPTDVDGKSTGKWDAWWFEDHGYAPRIQIYGGWLYAMWNGAPVYPVKIRPGMKCVPVANEGFPAPVGWHVVGG